jgi:hypothetical protein
MNLKDEAVVLEPVEELVELGDVRVDTLERLGNVRLEGCIDRNLSK